MQKHFEPGETWDTMRGRLEHFVGLEDAVLRFVRQQKNQGKWTVTTKK